MITPSLYLNFVVYCSSNGEASGGAALRWFWFPGEALKQLMDGESAGMSDIESNPDISIEVRRPKILFHAGQFPVPKEAEAVAPSVAISEEQKEEGERLLAEAAVIRRKALDLLGRTETVPMADISSVVPQGPVSSHPERSRKDKKHPRRSASGATAHAPSTTGTAEVKSEPKKPVSKGKFPKPPPKLMRAIGTAVHDWDMIREV